MCFFFIVFYKVFGQYNLIFFLSFLTLEKKRRKKREKRKLEIVEAVILKSSLRSKRELEKDLLVMYIVGIFFLFSLIN